MPPRHRSHLPAIGLMLLAILLFAVMDALIKWQTATYPVLQIVFFRSFIGLFVLAIPLSRGGLRLLRTRHPGQHLLRGLLGLASLVGFFAAFAAMPFGDVYAISFASPLLTTALSVPFLGEQVGWRRWIAVAVGLAGVLVMVQPSSGIFDVMALAALGATLAYALANLQVRRMSRTETNVAIVFYSGLLSSLASGAALPFMWQTPTWADLPWLGAIGVIGGLGHIVLTQSFRLAPASTVTPFEYSGMLWAVLFGWLFWREVPDLAFYAGAVLVIGAGLYILRRETLAASAPPDRLPGESAEG